MIITDELFGPNYRINVDKHQYAVQKRSVSKKTGKEHWSGEKYCVTLGCAITAIIQLQTLDNHKAMTLREYVSRIESSTTAVLNRINY